MFPRATGVGGKRSTIESERNSPNARARTMRTSATTDVSRLRARARPGRAGGDAPRPSPESAVRPGHTTADWRRSGRKAELAVRRELRSRERGMRSGPPHCEPQRAMFTPDPLPSGSTGGYNAVRRAHRAAGVSGYAEERGLCSAACVSWHGIGLQAEGGARGRCRRPHLRHRRVVRGELVGMLCPLARRFPAPIRADSGCGPVRVALGGTALPVVGRDGLVGAADEQRHGGFGVAVLRRTVQRCGPAGRRRRNRHSRRPTRSPDGPRGRAHP